MPDLRAPHKLLGRVLVTLYRYVDGIKHGTGMVCRAEKRGDFVFLVEDDGGHGKTVAAFTLWPDEEKDPNANPTH